MSDRQPTTWTISELARRWGVSRDRIRTMVNRGIIPGAFRIPSAGRFGEVVKIPDAIVRELEEQWQMPAANPTSPRRKRSRRGPTPNLSHFPELLTDAEPDPECPEADPG